MTPGELVTSNIRLVRLLGEGGMGSVWIAEHLALHTEVVVKFIQGTHASNPDALERFRREAALAAQARSPHVVQVFDYGVSQGGLPFIAMELLQGEDLGAYLERHGWVATALFADWLKQIAKGLTRTHAQGIIHRDIKPENLFLSEADGEITVKILDFGVAKGDIGPTFNKTATGAVVGTLYYMSPEQAHGGDQLDHRTDLWALGVVSYLALTGSRPFIGSSVVQLLNAIAAGRFEPPSEVRADLKPLDDWMQRALATAPEDRFASAKEMADAFAAALAKPTTSEPRPAVSGGGTLASAGPRQAAGERAFNTSLSPLTDAGVGPGRSARRRKVVVTAMGAVMVLAAVSYHFSSRLPTAQEEFPEASNSGTAAGLRDVTGLATEESPPMGASTGASPLAPTTSDTRSLETSSVSPRETMESGSTSAPGPVAHLPKVRAPKPGGGSAPPATSSDARANGGAPGSSVSRLHDVSRPSAVPSGSALAVPPAAHRAGPEPAASSTGARRSPLQMNLE